MKLKLFAFSAFLLFLLSAAPLHAQWTDRLTLYLPNRVLDIMDVFTLNLGGGPTLHGELYATRACEIGGGFGYTFQFIKDHNRQYGYAALNGFGTYLPFATREDIERRPGSLFVPEEWINHQGVPDPESPIYAPHTGIRDFWEIGGSIGALLIDATVSIHPVEILDAVLGFFLIDISDDDLTFENFR